MADFERMGVDKVEDWRTRHPYHPSLSGNAAFEKKYEGSCHCGRVRFWLSRDRPLAAKYCHCRDCQVLHGAPFQWAAIFEKEDLVFENGPDGLGFYHSADKKAHYDLPCKVSCEYCGSLIMDEGRNMVLLFPTLIKFRSQEERDRFSPECHIFYSQRVVDIPDGKPKWEGLDGEDKSTLLKDMA
ncbi:hypothetical protein V5O48_010446 [Marasmius crinis-equi]|uniref:CENP-V/GFA domain-containing protein n=1 Tax=Marasmius crinis-equi TaxID=585013 RepID=A0ABR3F8N1_9AGAR